MTEPEIIVEPPGFPESMGNDELRQAWFFDDVLGDFKELVILIVAGMASVMVLMLMVRMRG